MNSSPPSHKRNSASRLESANENKPVLLSLDQNIQHPVHAVVKVNVSRAGPIPFDKRARAWSDKTVTGFIADRIVGLRFNNEPGAGSPI